MSLSLLLKQNIEEVALKLVFLYQRINNHNVFYSWQKQNEKTFPCETYLLNVFCKVFNSFFLRSNLTSNL